MVPNIIAIALSALALTSSTFLAIRQAGLMRRANHLPAYMMHLDHFRSMEFNDRYLYVCQQLQREFDPQYGISGLPDMARRAVYDIAYFYQNIALLRLLGILDKKIIAVLNIRAVKVWEAIEPFVQHERSANDCAGPYMLRILEDFAKNVSSFPLESVDPLLIRRR